MLNTETMINLEPDMPDTSSFEYILQAFSFNNIQSSLQIKHTLDKKGISWDEYEQWVSNRAKEEASPPLRPMPDRIRTKLDKAGISWEDFSRWIEMVKQTRLPEELMVDIPEQRACPSCGQTMKQTRVNTMKCNQVGGDWKSIWNCSRCGYDKLDKEGIVTKPIKVHKRKQQSRIIDPKRVNMLYYSKKRRMR